MLRIRNEQMSAFHREMAHRFARKVTERFRADHADAAGDDPSDLERRALDGVLAAEAQGIRAELDVYLYTKHQLLHGAGFEARPGFEAARAVLADHSASWSVRLRRLDGLALGEAPARAQGGGLPT